MGVSFRIRNVGNGPFKVKFLPKTPRELLKTVKCRLRTGGKVIIPEALVPYLNKDHLNRCNTLGVISVKEVHTRVSEPIRPAKKKSKSQKTKVVDEDSKTGNQKDKTSAKAPTGKGAKSQQGGD